ncbi:MAG: hypothetical protein HN411_01545 [Waddliaceae bacterium]|jgi:hypothetical protein|nr:hypothetical protein [Waddliaceae bacterium]MBT3578474.1 hypothetical protein [Waddliaceae bacterium]MBT4444946.1 hypothetical protein [Waddliaceae bacterium]MBT6927990.1 hypothetical protein [Waddliaceae bacterium]MBT7263894.1 hypothetical protein [Waddliaceae bacterium]
MFKTIKRLFFLVVVIAIVGAYYSWTQRADLLSSYLSTAADVPVTIDTIDVGFRGITIEKFFIGNPRGSTLPTAFSTDSFMVKYNPLRIMTSPHEIEEIVIKDISVAVEQYRFGGGKSNWTIIIENLSPSGEESSDTEESATPSGERNVIIKRLLLENITVDVINPLLGKIHTTIPKIELYDIGEEGSFSPHVLMKVILDAMMRSLLTNPDLKKSLEDMINLPTKLLDTIILDRDDGEPIDLKESLEAAKDILKGEGKKLEDVLETFGGFFKGLSPEDNEDDSSEDSDQ